ncbi:unnamed protein product [Arctia plantaginis]|uniref:Zinc finger PHD-type domain-containing protein n=1 Tax=Arctia plantaginis TaxID=874455 RepID=A0A8S1ANC7_ARCPL|nr:unnamed protein product [Arctia plantaginis]
MDNNTKCHKCHNGFNKDDEATYIVCSKCGLYWHFICTTLRASPRDPTNWKCELCKVDTNKNKPKKPETSPSPLSVVDTNQIINDIKDLRKEMCSIKQDMSDREQNNPQSVEGISLEQRISIVEAKILDLENLSDIIKAVQMSVYALEERHHILEQSERICDLELHGVTEYNNEELHDMVVRPHSQQAWQCLKQI